MYDVRLLVAREHDQATTADIVGQVKSSTYGITVETFDEPRWHRSRSAAAALWARSVAIGIPPWIYGDLDHRLMARFSELANKADAIVLLQDFSGMYPLLTQTRRLAPIIADKHVVLARPRSARDGATARTRFLRRLTKRYELRYLALSSDVVVTTDEDGRWLESIYGRPPTAIIPTGVAVGPRRITGPSPRRRIGWLSALDVVDNIQGLGEFLRSGWPKLAAEGCELIVAGRNPGPEVFSLTNVPGVTLLGHVPSIDEFLATVDVGVIPLWSGRGIKVKTLTFMAAGIPVAATPMAVEGMVVDHGKECLIGDTPEELADHLLTLLDDHELADSIGEAGRQLIIRSFTWEALGREFVDVVDHAMARAE